MKMCQDLHVPAHQCIQINGYNIGCLHSIHRFAIPKPTAAEIPARFGCAVDITPYLPTFVRWNAFCYKEIVAVSFRSAKFAKSELKGNCLTSRRNFFKFSLTVFGLQFLEFFSFLNYVNRLQIFQSFLHWAT